MKTADLSRDTRSAALDAMQHEQLDVLVVGGGIVGAGTALDAVTRGLRTALVEAHDWASGTSSRSSKLIHGGLRYLEMFDFALVREALRERGLLVNHLAPHLVRPVAFLYPLRHHGWERAYAGVGVALYDLMASAANGASGLPRHRHLSRARALRLAPALRSDALTGAIQYYDAQVDDARYTMNVVRTAASHGAFVANRTRVVSFERSGEHVIGARLLDLETGREVVVHAKQVISATGVWTDKTQALAGLDGRALVRASKGIHLLVPRVRLDLGTGLILRTEKSVLFVIPWGAHWIIGTTDTDWAGDLNHPLVTNDDVAYLLSHVNEVLADPLTPEDVEAVYAGLRPLLTGDSQSTAKLSREHLVGHPAPGMVTVVGGKFTTYRVMAEDAVDEAVRDFSDPVPASRTVNVPLVGAEGWSAIWESRAVLAVDAQLSEELIEHLLRRYGTLTTQLLDLISKDRSLAEPLEVGSEYLRAEVIYAVSHEGALHLDDVLVRRTHLSIETADHGIGVAPQAARLMAPLLGWSSDEIARELARYGDLVDDESRPVVE